MNGEELSGVAPTVAPTVDPELWIERLRRCRCGVIVGDHGTGKSTLLHELGLSLKTRMPGGQWVQLVRTPGLSLWGRIKQTLDNVAAMRLAVSNVSAGGVLVVDGGEQLPEWFRYFLRLRIRRNGQYCLMTAHRDLPGFETLHRTALSAELLRDLFEELLSRCEIAPAVEAAIRDHFGRLDLSRFGNARDLWSELYEVAEAAGHSLETDSGASDRSFITLTDAG